MRFIKWRSAYAVDVPDMDDEHQALFELLAALQHALAENRPQEAITLLSKLKEHAIAHFTHEERLMRSTRYAHYAWHRRQHQAAPMKAALIEQSVREGDTQTALEMAGSLGEWLREHIAIADRMLSAHLRNHEREHAARAS